MSPRAVQEVVKALLKVMGVVSDITFTPHKSIAFWRHENYFTNEYYYRGTSLTRKCPFPRKTVGP